MQRKEICHTCKGKKSVYDECVDVCYFCGKLGHVSLNAHTCLKEERLVPLALTKVELSPFRYLRVTLLETCLPTPRIVQSWYLDNAMFAQDTCHEKGLCSY